jgi:hypothetical protein
MRAATAGHHTGTVFGSQCRLGPAQRLRCGGAFFWRFHLRVHAVFRELRMRPDVRRFAPFLRAR